MATDRKETDRRVIERVRQTPGGLSALDIAKASLGSGAHRYSALSLTMMGLGIASRLVRAGVLRPTRGNCFVEAA